MQFLYLSVLVLRSCVGWVWCVVITVHRTCVHLDWGWAGMRMMIPSVLLPIF